jgi:hypothetical protein
MWLHCVAVVNAHGSTVSEMLRITVTLAVQLPADSTTACTLPHLLTLHTATPSDSTNPTWDWLTDLASDVPQWALKEGGIALESAQALLGVSEHYALTQHKLL